MKRNDDEDDDRMERMGRKIKWLLVCESLFCFGIYTSSQC